MPEPPILLETMRIIAEGHEFISPTVFQKRLVEQFNDPKGFEKFMARMEKLELEFLAASKEAGSEPKAEVAEEVDESHEKLASLLEQLVAEFDPVAEATRLAQAAQSRQQKPSAKEG